MTLALPTPDWMDGAVCASVDPELFFPEAGGVWSATQARSICAGCPVQVDCLDYALAHTDLMGVWGGTNEKQRQRLRAGRREAA